MLLVANNFPPVRGGSAVVYDNLARHSNGRVIVVAPYLSYADGLPLIGWREHDRMAPYRVIRVPLLRTVIQGDPPRGGLNKLRFRARDLFIRVRLVAILLRVVVQQRVRTICIGELLASGWLIQLFRAIPFLHTIVYVHGEEITTDNPYDLQRRRRRKALLGADRIVVVSRFTLLAVRELLGIQGTGRIRLIENGVDTTRFRPRTRRADLVDLYHLDGCFVFVSVCRLLEKKGIDNAIRALAEIAPRHPECRYLIVGTGPYHDALRDIARSSGVADRVLLVGQVAEDTLAEHYGLGDVFVMPNRQLPNGDTEGFGLVFLEANGCGLPVIAGRDGGSTDAVRHGVNGLVVDGNSVAEIAAAMALLRTDAALRASLGRRGLEAAAAADWRGKAEALLQLGASFVSGVADECQKEARGFAP